MLLPSPLLRNHVLLVTTRAGIAGWASLAKSEPAQEPSCVSELPSPVLAFPRAKFSSLGQGFSGKCCSSRSAGDWICCRNFNVKGNHVSGLPKMKKTQII